MHLMLCSFTGGPSRLSIDGLNEKPFENKVIDSLSLLYFYGAEYQIKAKNRRNLVRTLCTLFCQARKLYLRLVTCVIRQTFEEN